MSPDNARRFLDAGRKIFSRSRPASPAPPDPAEPQPNPGPAPHAAYLSPVSARGVSRTTLRLGSTGSRPATPLPGPVPCAGPVQQAIDPRGGGSPSGIPNQPVQPASTTSPNNQGASGSPGGQAGGTMATPITAIPNPTNPTDDVFREALDKHKQGLTLEQQQALIRSSATGLMDIVEDLNKQNGKSSITRKSAMKVQGFLEVADGYLKILGICIQHSPEFSSLVVGGLRLFVDIGRRYTGFFDKLGETMQIIGSHLDYLSRYAKLYGHYAEVKKALCEAYGDLISFCTTVCGIFMDQDGKLNNKISARVLFKQLSSPLESSFDTIITSFTEHMTKVEKMANILESERKLLKETLEARDKAGSVMAQPKYCCHGSVLRLTSRRDLLWLVAYITDLERGKLLSWLSKLEPEDDLERIYAKRHGGTGMWLIGSGHLKLWFDAKKHCLLWCHGPAGVGKSVLASILIEEITSRHPFDDNIGIAFYYFSFQNETIQTRDVLSILIKQLCRRMKQLPLSIQTLYKQCSSNDKAPKLSELQAQFQSIIGTFDEVYLVVDAMDEFKLESRKQFLVSIVTLFEKCSGRFKIFVTSRPEIDIKRAFTSEKFQTIQVEATKVEEDISSYVRHELEHRHHDYCDIDQELRGEIESALVSQSGGMFLWVRCQLDYIYQQPSKQHMQDALKFLPLDMTATYRRILDRIYSQPDAVKTIAKRALTWVTSARRPLTPLELALAVAIEPTSDSALELCNKYQWQVVIDACCGLVTVEGDLVRPIHFTVKEFLRGSGTGIASGDDANAELVRSSIQYMLCKELAYLGGYVVSANNLFRARGAYIFRFWDHHVRDLPEPLPNDFKSLLGSFFNSSNIHAAYTFRIGAILERTTVLGLCATVDLLPIYRQFHTLDGPTVHPQVIQGALRDAARGGSISAITTLLDLCDAAVGRSSDLLSLAAGSGDKEAVQKFIDLGADVNGEGGQLGRAIHAASYGGHISVVETLLAEGADVNAQGGTYGSALQVASCGGHISVVETLLVEGVDVNALGGYYGSALQAASYGGHISVVETLLAEGADVNAQGGYYSSALQAASYGGHISVVETLLAEGADVNAQGGTYGNALQAASCMGNTSVVETLLAKGADVNAQGGDYSNALQAASCMGNTSVVETLLAKGADVNAQGGDYGSALQAASCMGNTSVVETLLANGADVNGTGGWYGSALRAASCKGHTRIVEMLLAKGAGQNGQ